MMRLREVMHVLEQLAPLGLAESWDNVGLLVGDEEAAVTRAMTCLTVTDSTLQEALDEQVELIVAHHPIPFKPIHRISSGTPTGRLLLQAIRAGIAIYSAHTAWDNAPLGINRRLAHFLGLQEIAPLSPSPVAVLAAENLGSGACGRLPTHSTIASVLSELQSSIPEMQARSTRPVGQTIQSAGIVCGSGGSCLAQVVTRGCDAMLTGEATYHQCLEAEAHGVALILMGHFASEFFAMKHLAELLGQRLVEVEFFASRREHSNF